MTKILEKLPGQLAWAPKIINSDKLKKSAFFVVGGMGGSHLSADLIKDEGRRSDMIIHSDYGLPFLSETEEKNALFIAVSHSGNTEETLDFAQKVIDKGLPLCAIMRGGKLEEITKKHSLPHLILPTNDIPPRLSTGYIAAAILALMGEDKKLDELSRASTAISSAIFEIQKASSLIPEMVGKKIPLIYSSLSNRSLAFYLKIGFNETAKMPAFMNQYPELNHNEMSGFDRPNSAADYCLITLEDDDDHQRTRRRMDLTESLITSRGGTAIRLELKGKTRLEKFWRFATTCAAISIAMAEKRNVEPFNTDLIEKFKLDLEK